LSDPPRIRDATAQDAGLIFSMILELADYEHAADRVVGTEEMLARALFGPGAVASAVIAEVGGDAAGYALFYTTFSTWLCAPGMWLEDLYVRERHRRSGAGGALVAHLAALALQRGCGRLEWAVLSWNDPAIEFYEKLGAGAVEDWRLRRLTGVALEQAARRLKFSRA
jgi:GNAT superfamily N-acetyltransferase